MLSSGGVLAADMLVPVWMECDPSCSSLRLRAQEVLMLYCALVCRSWRRYTLSPQAACTKPHRAGLRLRLLVVVQRHRRRHLQAAASRQTPAQNTCSSSSRCA